MGIYMNQKSKIIKNIEKANNKELSLVFNQTDIN